MADEEQKTEAAVTAGEPKSVERSVNVTPKGAPRKRAPAKKAPAKKSVAKKKAPVAATAAAPAAAATTPAVVAEKSKAAPAATIRRHTPPAKGIWWQTLIFIAIIVYLFSFIRDAAKGGQSEEGGAATQPVSQETAAPVVPTAPVAAPANGTAGPQAMGDNGIPAGTPAPDNLTVQPWTTPDGTMNMPPMPPRPYGTPAYPYPPRGYGFYGPDDWYRPGHPMPYPPMSAPIN